LRLDETSKVNIWLSDTDSIAIRQNLSQRVEADALALQSLYWLLSCFTEVLKFPNYSAVETLICSCWEHFDARCMKQSSFGMESDIDIAYASATANYNNINGGLTNADMKLSKKEAQSKLSPTDFKFWKKAQRTLKQKQDLNEDEVD